jgi:serine/threonine-protein kinase HipA
MLAPEPSIDPLAMLHSSKSLQRVRRPRKVRRDRRVKDVPAIEVRIWDQRAGAVALDPRLRYYAFAYEPTWRRTGIELATLTLPLDNRSAAFVFSNLPEATFHRMPGMLADALPDAFGNALIDAGMSGMA